MNLDELNQQFANEYIRFSAGNGQLPMATIEADGGTAEIYLLGAHVTRFEPGGHRPVLFMSEKSRFEEGNAIRGGIPICFPWFAANKHHPDWPAHGFARQQTWEVIETVGPTIQLELMGTRLSQQYWKHPFRLVYEVHVGQTLRTTLRVQNTGQETFEFEDALHTYLAVQDVRKVKVSGLADRTYIDSLDGGEQKTQSTEPITFTGETDRIYLNTEDVVYVEEEDRGILVEKLGSQSSVVWNPWVEKSKRMADFGDDEWAGMLCIETANVGPNRVKLRAQEEHVLNSNLRVE
ncbi:MAG: D-hexose-6-phosphate mutarotase [Phycisphaerae bacterium]